MKKLLACTAALALVSACAEPAEQEAPAEEAVAAADAVTDGNGDTMEAYLGDWDATYPDGSTGVTTNRDDGTYTVTMADGTTINGLWSFGPDQSCWHAEGEDEATCYTVGAPDADGARVLTTADGEEITVSPVAAEAEAAE